MSKKKDVIFTRILVFLHIVLVLAVLTSGFLAGLYFSTPFVHVRLKNPQESTNVWHIKLSDNGSVITGGNFKTTIAFYNTAIFPITFEPHQVEVFYYPIGTRPSCMYFHAEDNHFNELSDNKNIAMVHKTIESKSETFFKINDLKVTLASSRWDFTNPKHYVLNWNVGFEVPRDRLSPIKQLYMDCAKFEKIIFSMRLKDSRLSYLFMSKGIDSTFEFLVPMSCSTHQGTQGLFYNYEVAREPVLFQDIEHKTMSFF